MRTRSPRSRCRSVPAAPRVHKGASTRRRRVKSITHVPREAHAARLQSAPRRAKRRAAGRPRTPLPALRRAGTLQRDRRTAGRGLRGRRLGRRSAKASAPRRCGAAPPVRGPVAAGYIPNLPAYGLIGRIPTAAYPDDVQTTPRAARLDRRQGLRVGSEPDVLLRRREDPVPDARRTRTAPTCSTCSIGRVGTLAIPTDRGVAADTRPPTPSRGRTTRETGRPAARSPPCTGQPSAQIKHVFYIVRENRTYDQIFGSDPRGDGDPQLELFDDNGVAGPAGGITPNAHALSQPVPAVRQLLRGHRGVGRRAPDHGRRVRDRLRAEGDRRELLQPPRAPTTSASTR